MSENINPSVMGPLLVAVDDLDFDPENARQHDQRNVDAIAGSFSEFGQQKAIVAVRDGDRFKVIAGNGAVTAAKMLEWSHLAVVVFDSEDEDKARRFAIADNRTSDLSDWDFERLGDVFRADPDFDWGKVGWASYEVEPITQANWQPPAVDPDADPSVDPGAAPISVSSEQREAFEQAREAIREDEGDDSIGEGECVAKMSRFFLGQK